MGNKKLPHFEQYQDMYSRVFQREIQKTLAAHGISVNEGDSRKNRPLSKVVTWQVTDSCNLACTYCYQHNKGKRVMSPEIGKAFVDWLLSRTLENCEYINPVTSPAIVLEFIGGEPFLQVGLISEILDYWEHRCIELNHPWLENFMVSICSNGVKYFDPEVQDFLRRWGGRLSFSISIDGNKELHDACRIFPDGSPSYDIAVAGAKDWMDRGYYMGSKITLAPENIMHTYEAITHIYNLGYREINANCVYEEGWETKHATILYEQMKKLADFLLEREEDPAFISLFDSKFFAPMKETENDNWCFSAGTQVLTNKGYRSIEDIQIGDLVYTHDGSFKPVVDTKNHFAENVIKLKTSGGFETVCTNNHKFFTLENGLYTLKEIGNFTKENYIHLFDLPQRFEKIDPKIAYLVGRYIGDGWTSNGQYFICCSKEETEEFVEKLEESNIQYTLNKNKTVDEFLIKHSNKELINYIKDCGDCAHTKHFPTSAFSWDDSTLMALIDGYMDADGYCNKKGQYRCNTVSKQLANELMVILRTIGYYPTCYLNKRSGQSEICGRKVNIRDRYEVYYYKDKNRTRYIKEMDGRIWSVNPSITEAESQIVYNLTVDGNHSYVANGFVVSNCGGTGFMLSCDPDGYIYPCIRYMESSLGPEKKPIRLGNVWDGIGTKKEEQDFIEDMQSVTRRSQSTDECFYCPIASGCSWCSAYNYEKMGSYNKRATFICVMHKARSLANVYYWNKRYEMGNEDSHFKMNCPKEWAVPIIGEEEYSYLLKLSGENNEEN